MEFLMQPIRGSSFLEEVGESFLPPATAPVTAVPEPGAVVAVAPEQEVPEERASGLERAMSSAEAQMLTAKQATAERRDSSPPTLELSTGKMNPRGPGWNKRLRIGAAAPSRPPCATRVSAFEKAVWSYAENPCDNVVTPVIGMTFDSVGAAYDFYNLYSWEKGFGIRYGKSRLNVERTKCMQEIICGCSGKAGFENTRSCPCECPALIRLLRAEDNG